MPGTAGVRGVHGPVHHPGSPGYDAARRVWRRIDRRPAVVVAAADVDDVGTAIRMARDGGLSLTVQCTGHGAVEPSDGGLLLTTERMTGVRLDPAQGRAVVRAGTRLRDVIRAAAPCGLTPLHGSTPWLGAAGYTLGGGVGWLTRKFGYAADSLLAARVVTADGRCLTASAEENPDLFWGLRGAGAHLGVATELRLALHPLRQAYGGVLLFGGDRIGPVLRAYGGWAAQVPTELSTAVVVTAFPDSAEFPDAVRGRQALVLRVYHAGPAEEAERHLAALRAVAGVPVFDGLRVVDHARQADAPRPAPPRPHIGGMELCTHLTGDLVEHLVSIAMTPDRASIVEVRHWAGAIARHPEHHSPAGPRDVGFSVALEALLPDRDDGGTAERIGRLLDGVWKHSTGAQFLNLAAPGRSPDAYTAANRRRLLALKRRYDPDHLFRPDRALPHG